MRSHTIPQQSFHALFNDKSNIILPASSKVWLNSGSKLTFNSDFKTGHEKLSLKERLFPVSKDKAHPFRVKTTDIDHRSAGYQI